MMKNLIRTMCVGAFLVSAAPVWGQGELKLLAAQPAPLAESSPLATLCGAVSPASAPSQLGAQVFFRFGAGFLTSGSRGNGDYIDARAANGANDGTSGLALGFGFNLPLMKDPVFHNTLLGEVLIDYAQFSNKTVVPVTSALFGQPFLNEVRVNQLAIVGAPKYRFDSFGKLRPWVIPVGMAFLVNSPPSDNSSYLDVGLHFGVGADYRLTESLSLGVDCRYNLNLTREGGSWLTPAVYLGFDF